MKAKTSLHASNVLPCSRVASRHSSQKSLLLPPILPKSSTKRYNRMILLAPGEILLMINVFMRTCTHGAVAASNAPNASDHGTAQQKCAHQSQVAMMSSTKTKVPAGSYKPCTAASIDVLYQGHHCHSSDHQSQVAMMSSTNTMALAGALPKSKCTSYMPVTFTVDVNAYRSHTEPTSTLSAVLEMVR